MQGLAEYSGPFRPDARLEDFSNDTVARTLIAWNRLNLVLDRWWQDLARQRTDEIDIAEIQGKIWNSWSKKRPTTIRDAVGIDGSDLVSFLKCLQLDSTLCYGVYDLKWELDDARRALLRITSPVELPPLADLDHPDTAYRAAWLEPASLQRIARVFHPSIEVRQADSGEAYRVFEFVLDEDGEVSELPVEFGEAHELPDYSGPFRPNLRYQDFAKDRLMKLAYVYAGLGLDLDGRWQMGYRGATGDKEGVQAEVELWDRGSKYWQAQTINAVGIRGDDVSAAMKAMQMDPQHLLFRLEMEMVDEHRGVWTNRHCHAVEYSEATDDLYMQMNMCKLDWNAYRNAGSHFNANIEAFPHELPPRCGTDVCCKWELRLLPEPKAT
jgi:hypothetical protein